MNYGEYTYSEIAEELGVSRERVRQIEKEALKKLAARFRKMGYDEAYLRDIETIDSYTSLELTPESCLSDRWR
ncbi:MAG: RNA polymerase sigma factor RpoS [Gammaproteobacteria bacterium]|nr:MAG: RNA polymerase sigma factor RpoS [Gammaproteobacteria bacterium]